MTEPRVSIYAAYKAIGKAVVDAALGTESVGQAALWTALKQGRITALGRRARYEPVFAIAPADWTWERHKPVGCTEVLIDRDQLAQLIRIVVPPPGFPRYDWAEIEGWYNQLVARSPDIEINRAWLELNTRFEQEKGKEAERPNESSFKRAIRRWRGRSTVEPPSEP